MPRQKRLRTGGILQNASIDEMRREVNDGIIKAVVAGVEAQIDLQPIKLKIISDGTIKNTHVIDEATGKRVANITSIEMNLTPKDSYVRVNIGLVGVKLEMSALSNVSNQQRRLIRLTNENDEEETAF